MANRAAILNIQKLTPEELSECLDLNGYSECCGLIEAQNIDGQKFLNLSEFQLKLWKSQITLIQASRLYSFIQRIKNNPADFVFLQQKESTRKNSVEPKYNEEISNKLSQLNVEKLAQALRNQLNTAKEVVPFNMPLPPKPDHLKPTISAQKPQESHFKPQPKPNFTSLHTNQGVKPKAPPPIFRPPPQVIEPQSYDLPEYDVADVDYDPDGYLLANEIQPANMEEEENEYNEPTVETPPPRPLPKIIHRPLPLPPREEPPPKKFIEIFAEQNQSPMPKSFIEIITEEKKQEEIRQALLETKFKYETNTLPKKAPAVDPDYNRQMSLPRPPKPMPEINEQNPTPILSIDISKRKIEPKPRHKMSLPKPPIDFVPKEIAHDIPDSISPKIVKIEEMPCYRFIDRKGAEMLLYDEKDGTYLIRPSNKFYCTLNVIYNRHVYNIGIKQAKDGRLMGTSAGLPNFENIKELLDFYVNNPLEIKNTSVCFTLKYCLPSDKF